jgi:hypothetical protein
MKASIDASNQQHYDCIADSWLKQLAVSFGVRIQCIDMVTGKMSTFDAHEQSSEFNFGRTFTICRTREHYDGSTGIRAHRASYLNNVERKTDDDDDEMNFDADASSSPSPSIIGHNAAVAAVDAAPAVTPAAASTQSSSLMTDDVARHSPSPSAFTASPSSSMDIDAASDGGAGAAAVGAAVVAADGTIAVASPPSTPVPAASPASSSVTDTVAHHSPPRAVLVASFSSSMNIDAPPAASPAPTPLAKSTPGEDAEVSRTTRAALLLRAATCSCHPPAPLTIRDMLSMCVTEGDRSAE